MPTVPGPVRNLRTRTGCLTCRTRKVKCGEERPVCFSCQRLSRICKYEASPVRPTVNTKAQACNILNNLNVVPEPFAETLPLFHEETVESFIDSNWQTGEWGDLLDGFSSDLFGAEFIKGDSGEQSGCQLNCGTGVKLDVINMPFITPYDSLNWGYFTEHVVQLAQAQPTIALCIDAIEQMSSILSIDEDVTDALPQYFKARSAFVILVRDPASQLEIILIATFLLCCSEVLAQQDTIPVTLKQKDILVTRIEQEIQRPKSPIVRRIIAWLHLFHAKASHFGGRGILSPRLFELLNDEEKHVPTLSYLSTEPDVTKHATLSVHQDLFHFYHALQHISIRASGLNRHHRSRGTADDETAVTLLSHDIEQRLQYLWQSRPSILRIEQPLFDPELEHLVQLCKLAYHAEVIYHARANGQTLDLFPNAIAAKEIIRASITGMQTNASGLLPNPALMWPLFQYSIESKTSEQVQWALAAMKPISGRLWHTEFFKDFARALTSEQLSQNTRMDSRYLCIKHFGISPAFM